MDKPKYFIASFSGGKDSTAMVLRMIELDYDLDEVLFCDTTMEFPAMLRHVEQVKAVVEAAGIKFTTLRPEHDFEWWLLEHTPKRRNPELQAYKGLSWPTSRMRWCTGAVKKKVCDRYLRTIRCKYELIQYIGLAADETYRLTRKNNQDAEHRHPLVDWGWTEDDAMNYCRKNGYDWEGLYNIFNRVSCWCCPLQSLNELRKLRKHFPELWEHLDELDKSTWTPFKEGYSVSDLDQRFRLEEALTLAGEKITNRKFYTDLRRCLQDGVSIDEIVAERTMKDSAREGGL